MLAVYCLPLGLHGSCGPLDRYGHSHNEFSVTGPSDPLSAKVFQARVCPQVRTWVIAGKSELTSLANVPRSMQLEIRVFSPAIKSTPGVGGSPGRTLPVFDDDDEVAGVVLLDPRYCTSPGRITVTVGISRPVFPHRLKCILLA